MSVYMSRSIYSIFLLSTLFFISRERLIFGPRMNVLLKIFKNILRISASNVLKTFLNIIVSIEFTLTTLHMHDTKSLFLNCTDNYAVKIKVKSVIDHQ